jgi:hypothetical protein
MGRMGREICVAWLRGIIYSVFFPEFQSSQNLDVL